MTNNLLSATQLETLTSSIRTNIRLQFEKEQVLEYALEELKEYLPRPLDIQLSQGLKGRGDKSFSDSCTVQLSGLIEEQISICLEEEKAWPIQTDCDRLKAALSNLESKGILAKENFSCCQTCGLGDILDLADGQYVGYVYYTAQDAYSAQTDVATCNTHLYLAYGRTGLSSDLSVEEVASKIVNFLTAEGLEVHWDGTVKKRILVSLNWQRRLSNKFL